MSQFHTDVCMYVFMYVCVLVCVRTYVEREREMFYLTTHSTHVTYGYMASDIWLRTILIVRKETRCRHSYRLTARVLLYAPSHIQDNTYHGLCYTSRGALAGTRRSYVHTYVYVCVCVCMCVYVLMYDYIYVLYVCTCMYVCMHVYV